VTKKATAAANAAKKEKAAAAKEKKAATAEKKKKAAAAAKEKKKAADAKKAAAASTKAKPKPAATTAEETSPWNMCGTTWENFPPGPEDIRDAPYPSSSSPSSSLVSSTRDPPVRCGGVWSREEVAARDAKRAVQRKAAKAKLAKQQAKAGTKTLSAAALEEAEEREMWMMEKKERKRKSLASLAEFIAKADDETVHTMRAAHLERQAVPDRKTMELYDERLEGVDMEELDERARRWAGGPEAWRKRIQADLEREEKEKKKASPKKASPKKASPKKASPKKASPKKKTT
jgi:hypothetical protein